LAAADLLVFEKGHKATILRDSRSGDPKRTSQHRLAGYRQSESPEWN
jgi:hypothetical protein